jgi:hypothetical protein
MKDIHIELVANLIYNKCENNLYTKEELIEFIHNEIEETINRVKKNAIKNVNEYILNLDKFSVLNRLEIEKRIM